MMSSTTGAVQAAPIRHVARRSIENAAVALLLLPAAAFGIADENFDGISAQIQSTSTYFDNDSLTEWTFTQVTPAQIAVAGIAMIENIDISPAMPGLSSSSAIPTLSRLGTLLLVLGLMSCGAWSVARLR